LVSYPPVAFSCSSAEMDYPNHDAGEGLLPHIFFGHMLCHAKPSLE
jgi:hypothetical protein